MSLDYDIELDRTDVSDDFQVRMLAIVNGLEKIQLLLKDIDDRIKTLDASVTSLTDRVVVLEEA